MPRKTKRQITIDGIIYDYYVSGHGRERSVTILRNGQFFFSGEVRLQAVTPREIKNLISRTLHTESK